MKFLLSFVLFISLANASFLPDDIVIKDKDINLLQLEDNKKMVKEVIKHFKKTYGMVALKRGGKISINDVWWSKTFNAYAMKYGPIWRITVHGGLLKHKDLTPDLLSLVLCHELGHFLGGAPKFTTFGKKWSSLEGQSDYWTGQHCLKKLFEKEKEHKSFSTFNIDPTAQTQCNHVYQQSHERQLCYRVAMTGLKMGSLIAEITGKQVPSLDTPDPNVVDETYKNHPNFQCRVDTYFQSSLCPRTGDVSDDNPRVGTCYEQELGQRPACWFAKNNF